jgi:hypothetical protein
VSLHGGDNDQRSGPRSSSKRVAERRYAEEFDTGTRLRWSSPPTIRIGAQPHRAPSSSAVVSFHITGAAFARFRLDTG